VFESPQWGLYVLDRGCTILLPDSAKLGILNGRTGWLRGGGGVWHRQAGFYLPQCAATYSRDSLGADLAPGQLAVCRCSAGLCWGGAAGAVLPPAPQPCFCGPHY